VARHLFVFRFLCVGIQVLNCRLSCVGRQVGNFRLLCVVVRCVFVGYCV